MDFVIDRVAVCAANVCKGNAVLEMMMSMTMEVAVTSVYAMDVAVGIAYVNLEGVGRAVVVVITFCTV